MPHLAVRIGVPDESDANELSRSLVEERLAAGTRITSSTSHYRWDGHVTERTYWTVTAFTHSARLSALYEFVEKRHEDELPGITYTEIGADDEYLRWIRDAIDVGAESDA